jgi:hypothetical protein
VNPNKNGDGNQKYGKQKAIKRKINDISGFG